MDTIGELLSYFFSLIFPIFFFVYLIVAWPRLRGGYAVQRQALAGQQQGLEMERKSLDLAERSVALSEQVLAASKETNELLRELRAIVAQ